MWCGLGTADIDLAYVCTGRHLTYSYFPFGHIIGKHADGRACLNPIYVCNYYTCDRGLPSHKE